MSFKSNQNGYKIFARIDGDHTDPEKLKRMSGYVRDFSTIPGGFSMKLDYANQMNPERRLVMLHVQRAKHVVRVIASASRSDDAEMAAINYIDVMSGNIIPKV